MGGSVHVKTVEVETGRLIAKLVVDIDHDLVSHGGGEVRQWPLPIDANRRTLLLSVRISQHPCNVPVVCDCGGLRE